MEKEKEEQINENSAETNRFSNRHVTEITESVMLIRINKSFSTISSAEELYNCTRGVWKVSERRDYVSYAFAVYRGTIIETYAIKRWEKATRYDARVKNWRGDIDGRWQFIGEVDERLHEKYVGKDVSDYFPHGAANPILYLDK